MAAGRSQQAASAAGEAAQKLLPSVMAHVRSQEGSLGDVLTSFVLVRRLAGGATRSLTQDEAKSIEKRLLPAVQSLSPTDAGLAL